MNSATARHPPRAEVLVGLQARRQEIEDAVRVRAFAVSDRSETEDTEYLEGLRGAISAAIDFGLQAIEADDLSPPSIPVTLLTQARIAARNSVSLDTVLRRYLGGHTTLGDFVIQEAEAQGLRGPELHSLLRSMARLFDCLVAAVSEEYTREQRTPPRTLERRRAKMVEALLSGERFDAPELGYELRGWHLAVLASASEAPALLHRLATELDRRLLVLLRDGDTVWAWLGGREPLDPPTLRRRLAELSPGSSVALGEPGEGLPGWRLSHRQAAAAMPVALRGPDRIVHYAEVALLSCALKDEVLLASLRELYLVPLWKERDGGAITRQTLRAYFSAGRNVSSAASVLGVSRQTVGARLRAAEDRFGRSLDHCAAELELALRLAETLPLDEPRYNRR